MSLTSMGLVIGLALDVLIAFKLGTTAITDGLFIGLALPIAIDTVAREGTKLSLIPSFIIRKEEDRDYSGYVSAILNASIVLGLIMAALSFFFSQWIVRVIGPGLNATGNQVAFEVLAICSLALVFIPPIAVLSVNLNSQKVYEQVALRNAVIPFTVLILLIIGWGDTNLPSWIAWGNSIGFSAFFIFLLVTSIRKGYRYRFLSFPDRRLINELGKEITWPTLGFMIRYSIRVIERSIASLIMVGGVSSYYFAFKIFTAIQVVIGNSFAVTGISSLVQARESADLMKVKILRLLGRVSLIVAPVILVIFFFGDYFVQFVFERGAFDSNSVETTTAVLYWLAPGILFISMVPILNSALYSIKKHFWVFVNMATVGAINISLAYLLGDLMGITGLALSVSLTGFLSFVSLVLIMRKHGISLGLK